MSEANDKTFVTRCILPEGANYIFASLDRKLNSQESMDLTKKYAEKHHEVTPPGDWLFVDLRPAFRKPLADITPEFRSVSKDYDPLNDQ
jgi:hypothetical protein